MCLYSGVTEKSHKEDCYEQEQVQNALLLVGVVTQPLETQVCLVNLVHNFKYE